MLEQRDFLVNHRLFQFYSSSGFIPLEFGNTFTTAKFQESVVKLRLWRLQWALALMLGLFKTIRLIQSLLYPEFLILQHLMVHVTQTFLLFVGLYTSWMVKKRGPEIITIFNYSFEGFTGKLFHTKHHLTVLKLINLFWNCTGNTKKSKRSSLRFMVRKLRTWTMSEMILVSLLPATVCAGVSTIVLFLYDPRRMDFVYSVLPEKYQQYGPLLFSCLTLESFIMNFAYCNMSFAAIVQLGMFRKCLLDLKTWLAFNLHIS